nr:phage tail domain-containing protein [Bacillus thuringiensis]
MKFGVKGEQKYVTNNGDIDSPVYITIHGPCTNPVITNLTTMNSIKIEREVPAGWRLEIDTAYGHNTVVLVKDDGSRINAYNWIAPGVRLNEFRLQRGLNVIDYNADIGKESTTIVMRYRERFTGI